MPEFAVDLSKWFEAERDSVQRDLVRYFSGRPGDPFTGRWFDRYAALSDPSRFTAADVIAVEALSVQVPPEAAAAILLDESERFNRLLTKIPSDVDLWNASDDIIGTASPASALHAELDQLVGIGTVTAGKLLAAKRPRLVPVYDDRVRVFLSPPKGRFWITLRDTLANADARRAIDQVCAVPVIPDGVGLLRRIDVAIWMAGERA